MEPFSRNGSYEPSRYCGICGAKQEEPPPRAPRAEGKAIASLVLGVMSLPPWPGAVAGILAMVLGTSAKKDIRRSQGTLSGSRLATCGIVTGFFGTFISVALLGALAAGALDSGWPMKTTMMAPWRESAAKSTRLYETLEVIDLDDRQPLSVALASMTKNAHLRGRIVILQTYVRTSRECADVASALADPRMQKALTNVTLVRVDVDAFEVDLNAMRIDTDTVPWFYKLDAAARPSDAISADEWDDNTATNMAPVLGAFARGVLSDRRTDSPLGTEL
jgi:hypothetical protein